MQRENNHDIAGPGVRGGTMRPIGTLVFLYKAMKQVLQTSFGPTPRTLAMPFASPWRFLKGIGIVLSKFPVT